MSWSRLEDALLDHPKIATAGASIGRNGEAIALGLYAVGLMWTNKHLTDGVLPAEIVRSFRHLEKPERVARALVAAGLWEKIANGGGYRIHDFHAFNFTAAEVAERRAQRIAAGKNGARIRWHK